MNCSVNPTPGGTQTPPAAAGNSALRPLAYDSAQEPTDYRVLWPAVCALLPPVRPGQRLLDVGCGNGYWANRFSEIGYAVTGVDPSPSGINLARQAYPHIRFEPLSAEAGLCEQLGEKPFDVVVSLEVVEHVYAPRQWAEACHSALVPGGTLLLSTPYHGYLKNLAISLAGAWDKHFSPRWEGGHIKFWSRNTLAQLLADAGFRREGMRFRGAGRAAWLWKSLVLAAMK